LDKNYNISLYSVIVTTVSSAFYLNVATFCFCSHLFLDSGRLRCFLPDSLQPSRARCSWI